MKPKKVELLQQNGQYQLTVDGQPFYINGAGIDLGNIKSLADFGGNAFRTWRVDNGEKTGLEILDEAHRHGLMVCMGIEVARERHGFDYDDKLAVAKQMAEIKKDILELKDHPALLMWGIGNELNLRHTNPMVWDAVNQLSEMIHKIDPNHPTTTMLAGAESEVILLVAESCPDLDLLSFQIYGEIDKLPGYLQQSKYLGAYMITEWGATGHWESPNTEWNRSIEANSSDKAESYRTRYLNYIAADKQQCIGSFVFLWGQKQERTPTWYGLFLENGKCTEAAQVMRYLWTGERPKQPVPSLSELTIDGMHALDNVRLKAGQSYTAEVNVDNSDQQDLNYCWQLMKEVDRELESDGGDFEPTPDIVWQQSQQNCCHVKFETPGEGEYRLFIYVDNAFNGSATANLPILVESSGTPNNA